MMHQHPHGCDNEYLLSWWGGVCIGLFDVSIILTCECDNLCRLEYIQCWQFVFVSMDTFTCDNNYRKLI